MRKKFIKNYLIFGLMISTREKEIDFLKEIIGRIVGMFFL